MTKLKGPKGAITQDEANKLFKYEDGRLYWKKSPAKGMKDGSRAGGLNSNGYRVVRIDNRGYREHRVIFLMFNGYMPRFIDHINMIRDDNRIENLREANRSQNGINRKMQSNNTSGYRGVAYHRGKWVAGIQVNNKHIPLGYYYNKEDAAKAYAEASEKYHGKFSNISCAKLIESNRDG